MKCAFIIKKFLFVFCCVMNGVFFFLLFCFLSLSSVCSVLFFLTQQEDPHILQKKTVEHHFSHQSLSLSLSFSLLCFFSREHVLCASKQREREKFVSVFFVFFFFCCSERERERERGWGGGGGGGGAERERETPSFSNARVYIYKNDGGQQRRSQRARTTTTTPPPVV